MSVSEQKAGELAGQLVADGMQKSVAFDPLTILVIANLIMALVKMVMACVKDHREGIRRIKHPTSLDRLRMRVAVWRHLRGHKALSRHAGSIREGLLDLGATMGGLDLMMIWTEALQCESARN